MRNLLLIIFVFCSVCTSTYGHVNLNDFSNVNIQIGKESKPQFLFRDGETIQFVSHGKPGYLWIDNSWLNTQEIANYFAPRLGSAKQLNIYGCEFAKGELGKNAIAYLEKTLKVNIGASDNITGKDGDWVLEKGHPNNTIVIPNFEGNLQLGTVGSPYTSLAQASCNTNPGVKYFNLNGVTFSTYVDASGNVLVANDFTSNTGTLSQTTSLNVGSSYGILSATVLAQFGAAKQIRIRSGNGNVDEISSAAGNITRLVNFEPLVKGTGTTTDNNTWVNLGSDVTITFTGASCLSQYRNLTLAESIIHPCGNAASFNWIPIDNYRYEDWGQWLILLHRSPCG